MKSIPKPGESTFESRNSTGPRPMSIMPLVRVCTRCGIRIYPRREPTARNRTSCCKQAQANRRNGTTSGWKRRTGLQGTGCKYADGPLVCFSDDSICTTYLHTPLDKYDATATCTNRWYSPTKFVFGRHGEFPTHRYHCVSPFVRKRLRWYVLAQRNVRCSKRFWLDNTWTVECLSYFGKYGSVCT